MKKLGYIALSYLAIQAVYAVEPHQVDFNVPITICEMSEAGNFQFDLLLKGNGQLGLISGVADTTNQRLCADNINVSGQYGAQADGTFLVTFSTLIGDTGNCDAWAYQIIWSGNKGTGDVVFFNDETEATTLEIGACPSPP